MSEEDIEILFSNDINKIKKFLVLFNSKNANLFDFTEFDKGQWQILWQKVFDILQNEEYKHIYPECLSCIRILSRDKLQLNANIDSKYIDRLLQIANLQQENSTNTTEIAVESLKCLCNITFQSTKCQELYNKNNAIEGLLRRIKSNKIYPYKIEYYDMKLLFLITALNISTRTKVCDDLNGLTYLKEWLDLKIQKDERSEEQIDLICEILKVLFNITVNLDIDDYSGEREIQFRRITSILRTLLINYDDLMSEKRHDLMSNTINLLTNIPTTCFSELLDSSQNKNTFDKIKYKIYEGKIINAIDVILEYFMEVLKENESSPGYLDQLSPVLTVLVKCVRSSSILRHYIRLKILPPLKDVSKRPEEGTELRNYLCRFLTVPCIQIRDLVSELIFVCCKENVSRMIKYTGYGNVAGLLANRGLLDGHSKENLEYSSDSENSDTEEYKLIKSNINPVTGCYEPTKSNSLENMTQEQKEFEAMNLVNLIDQLQKQGIVQPCCIGEDGRPKPVDHILQLNDHLSHQNIDNTKKS